MKYLFSLLYGIVTTFLSIFFLKELYGATEVIIPYSITPYDICYSNPTVWNFLKIVYPFL